MKLRSKDLTKLGVADNVARSLALDAAAHWCKHDSAETIMLKIANVVSSPQDFYDDYVWGKFARAIKPEKTQEIESKEYDLFSEPKELNIFGQGIIETDAIRQMELVLRLPISVKGALMPDAHAGYGLPIGGVLAADRAVIPYGVGLDIGCGMMLTVLDAKADFVKRYSSRIERVLLEWTHFGMEGGLAVRQDHEVMDRDEWHEISLLKRLQRKAWQQLGSSGGGNHFVEIGVLDVYANNGLGLP